MAGTFLDVELPLIDPAPLILAVPLVLVPGLAGAVLRGTGAVISIMAGAFAAPLAAIGLISEALYALVIAGAAAFVADRLYGDARLIARFRVLAAVGLVVISAVGLLGLIAAVTTLYPCP